MKSIIYLLMCTCAFTISCDSKRQERLPILGERSVAERVREGKKVVDTVYQTIPEFRFLNQDSLEISQEHFKGKIYVADFFFTSCTSICPTMHRNMLKVFQEFKGNEDVGILSHTIDFKYDTPSRLKAYAGKLGVTGSQWQFVRGEKDSVYALAQTNYLVAVAENKTAKDGFVHQGWFILVDKEKRLRGAYDGTKEADVDKLINDMKILIDEYR